jgi:hypothetical protein
MGTGSQCLRIAREPQNLTIPRHGGGPGAAPCAIRAHPVRPPPAPIRERSGEGGEENAPMASGPPPPDRPPTPEERDPEEAAPL